MKKPITCPEIQLSQQSVQLKNISYVRALSHIIEAQTDHWQQPQAALRTGAQPGARASATTRLTWRTQPGCPLRHVLAECAMVDRIEAGLPFPVDVAVELHGQAATGAW